MTCYRTRYAQSTRACRFAPAAAYHASPIFIIVCLSAESKQHLKQYFVPNMLRHFAQKTAHGLRSCAYYDTFRWHFHTGAPAAAAFGSTLPSPTNLAAIVNMDKMLQRDPEQITALWQEVSLPTQTL